MYSVKEIFHTIQGEGANMGRAAVFCRFTGCNLWSGREEDRADAICSFCDTEFVGTDGLGGGKFNEAADLAARCEEIWQGGPDNRLIVCTGGEPMLQLDAPLIEALKARGFTVAIETNGTIPIGIDIDWICVSPKAGSKLKQISGNELKLVVPQEGQSPEDFAHLEFEHFFLQPMESENTDANTNWAVQYCMSHPKWRLSLQTHKILGIR